MSDNGSPSHSLHHAPSLCSVSSSLLPTSSLDITSHPNPKTKAPTMHLPHLLLLSGLALPALSAPTSTLYTPSPPSPYPYPFPSSPPKPSRPSIWQPNDSQLMPNGSILHADGKIQVHGNFYLTLVTPYYSDSDPGVDLCEIWEPYLRHPTERWHDHCEGGEWGFFSSCVLGLKSFLCLKRWEVM
jgi:hypothetical protein